MELTTPDHEFEALKLRMSVADEMLAKLIDDIGTGPGVASLRKQALDIKHELRGIRGTFD